MDTKKLFFLFAVALILRMALFYFLPEPKIDGIMPIMSDASDYDNIAMNFLKQHTYVDARRPPVYPLFLVATYLLFGHSPQIVIFFQMFLSALTCLFVYKIGKLIFNEWVGLFAGLLFAFDLTSIMYSNILMSDALFTLLVAISIYLFIKFLLSEKFKYVAFSATFLGVATLCKPVPAYYILFLSFLLGIFYKNNTKKMFIGLIITTAIFTSIVSPWVIRNYIVYGCPSLRIDHWLVELLAAHPIEVELIKQNAKTEQEKLQAADTAYFEIRRHYPQDVSSIGTYKLAIKIAKKKIVEHPFIFLKVYTRGIYNFFTLNDYPNILKKLNIDDHKIAIKLKFLKELILEKGFSAIFGLNAIKVLIHIAVKLFFCFLQIISLFFAALGFYFGIKKKQPILMLLIFLTIFYFALISGTEGCARYRLPVIPFIYIIAVYGISSFFTKLSLGKNSK